MFKISIIPFEIFLYLSGLEGLRISSGHNNFASLILIPVLIPKARASYEHVITHDPLIPLVTATGLSFKYKKSNLDGNKNMFKKIFKIPTVAQRA